MSSALILSFLQLVMFRQCKLIFLADCDLSSEEFESMTEWLKHNVEPVSQVSSFMKKTAVKRAEWIRNNPGQPFDNILREYPRLFDTPGMVITFLFSVSKNCLH